MVKDSTGELRPCEWEDALIAAARALKGAGSSVAAVVGGQVDAESLTALKDLVNRLGSEVVCTEEVHAGEICNYNIGRRSASCIFFVCI